MIRCTLCKKKADTMYAFSPLHGTAPICYRCRQEKLKLKVKCDTCGEVINRYNKHGIADFFYTVSQCNSCYYEENRNS